MTETLTPASAPIGWRQPLPRIRCGTREDFLVSRCRDRRVVHVGFVDDRLLEARLAQHDWLHARLAEAASSVAGLDCAAEGVLWARAHGYEAYAVDAQSSEQVAALELEPADVIVAGEIIEHLDAPGSFLRAMRLLVKPDGMLIVTTPNAYRPLNVVAPLFGFELIHPDHTAWHSPHTLACLMTRNGWHVESIGYYQNPADQGLRERGLRRRLAGHAAGALSSLARWVPAWSDGLVVGARPDDGNNP